MRTQSILFHLIIFLLLSSLTVPVIACLPPDCGSCCHWVSTGPDPEDGYCELDTDAECGDCSGCSPCKSCIACFCIWDCIIPGATCCNGICCNSGNCCNSTKCCPNSDDVCCTDSGSYCCDSGETCCQGSCCTTDQCCDDGDCVDDCPTGECCDDGDCVDDCPTGECCDDGTCVSSCPTGECCDDGECVIPDDWSDWTTSITVSMPDDVTGKIESAVESIPNVGDIDIESAEVSCTAKWRDCCTDGGTLISNGERYRKCSFTVTAAIDGIPIWGPPTFNETFEITGVLKADLKIKAGVTLDADCSIGATGGQRWDDCDEGCLFGSVDADVDVTLSLTLEIDVCVKILWWEECGSIEFTPASVSVGITCGVSYNSETACDGLVLSPRNKVY